MKSRQDDDEPKLLIRAYAQTINISSAEVSLHNILVDLSTKGKRSHVDKQTYHIKFQAFSLKFSV